jgi:hypothetical protein
VPGGGDDEGKGRERDGDETMHGTMCEGGMTNVGARIAASPTNLSAPPIDPETVSRGRT